MYSQVAVLLGLVCTSLAFPRTYQEQRQIYYQQPLPVPYGAYQLPQQQQQPIFQVPASTSFLPNNVPGLRYGQQQIVYVVPGGSQLLYEEGSTGGPGNSPYLENFMNFLNGHLPSSPIANRPGAETQEKPVEKPTEEKPAENSVNASQEQEASGEEVTPPVEVLKPQSENAPAQLQQLPVQQPIQLAPLPPQHLAQPSAQDQQLLQQQLLQQRFYLLNQPQQYQPQQYQAQQYQPQQLNQALYSRPAITAPTANYLLNYRTFPLSDKKPGSSAIAFQKLLQKNAEAAASSANNTAEGESTENDASSSEEIGPSIAQAKPQAVSIAGPGGVAAAAPVGTAIVGPGGMALSAPTATAVAGTKPKPSDKTKNAYLRSNLYPF